MLTFFAISSNVEIFRYTNRFAVALLSITHSHTALPFCLVDGNASYSFVAIVECVILSNTAMHRAHHLTRSNVPYYTTDNG